MGDREPFGSIIWLDETTDDFGPTGNDDLYCIVAVDSKTECGQTDYIALLVLKVVDEGPGNLSAFRHAS